MLLDLPDFDSREVAHRVEAERILELVDVFVWVTDPQKYADARLHDDFVSILSRHGAVTLAVLNQSDRLSEAGVKAVVSDLGALLESDGVRKATVLPTSTVTGAGLDKLRQRLANAVAGHAASRQRLRSDLVGAASALRHGVADSEPDTASLDRRALDASLARSAGVPIVLDAVARDYRREAFAHTGWLFARWTKGFAADPLRRLRLDRDRRATADPGRDRGRRRACGARQIVDPDAHRGHRLGGRPRHPHLRARCHRRTSGAVAAVGRGRRRRG